MPRVAARCLLALAALAGCASERQRLRSEIAPTREQILAEGRETYERACASCHGADGRGHGPAASTLRLPPPDLTQLAGRHGGVFPRQEVRAVITGATPVAAHGTAEMPVWRLRFGPASSGATAVAALRTERRLDAMLDYLATLQVPA